LVGFLKIGSPSGRLWRAFPGSGRLAAFFNRSNYIKLLIVRKRYTS
jgi:hypothetical protein